MLERLEWPRCIGLLSDPGSVRAKGQQLDPSRGRVSAVLGSVEFCEKNASTLRIVIAFNGRGRLDVSAL
jgi:hypothetical protein